MTALEQTLSKAGLARLDTFRKSRGIRTRKQALEIALEELVDEEIPTEEELKIIHERLASYRAGHVVSAEEVRAEIIRRNA